MNVCAFVFIQDYVHTQTHIYHTTKPRVSKQIAFRKHANINTLLILCDTQSIGQVMAGLYMVQPVTANIYKQTYSEKKVKKKNY